MLDDFFIKYHVILLTDNPFKEMKEKMATAGDVGTVTSTVVTYSQDIYTLLMWVGFFGAVLSLISYLVVKYMIQAGSLSPRLAYERKEAVKQIVLWTIALSLILFIFGVIQRISALFG